MRLADCPGLIVTCSPYALDAACCQEWVDLSVDLQERAASLAWATMRTLTGGLVGGCPVSLRPCEAVKCDPCIQAGPVLTQGGQWVNVARCGGDGCSCEPLSEVVLPGRVAEVTAVTLDGVALTPGVDYRLDGNRLLRLGGLTWPMCQDMTLPNDAVGAFTVTYVPGLKPDAAGLWAVGVLACEFAQACQGGKCRLPSSVQTITRQGVSMSFDNTMFSNGLTGIREVDAYILSVNPHRMRTPTKVWTPDAGHARTVSGV